VVDNISWIFCVRLNLSSFDDESLEVDAVAEFDTKHQCWYGVPDWSTRRDLPQLTKEEMKRIKICGRFGENLVMVNKAGGKIPHSTKKQGAHSRAPLQKSFVRLAQVTTQPVPVTLTITPPLLTTAREYGCLSTGEGHGLP